MMSLQSSEPAYYPPPPPLLPRGLRPPNASMYRHILPQQLPPGHMMSQPQPVLMAMTPHQQPPQPTPPANLPPNMTEEELEKRVDKSSIKGNFGWMTLDSVNIPCIFRGDEKYVSVRMVEQKLLSKYPSTYPDELRQRPPLMSQFITPAEAKLLNEINIEHCECEFGQQAFTEKDLIVSWPDFGEFYKIVKKHFPNENIAAKQKHSQTVVSCGGGWVQINNTVVPYLKRLTPNAKETLRLAPLPVIKYAAGLLNDTEVPCLEPTDDECTHLTEMCKKAGLEFTFSTTNTQLVLLSMISAYSGTKVVLKKLPDNDPFASAEYCPEMDDTLEPVPLGGVVLPTIQHNLSPPFNGRTVTNSNPYMAAIDKRPPPNVTVMKSPTNPHMPVTVQSGMMPPHGASSPSLQALEQMSGAPMKRQKTSASSHHPATATITSQGPINNGPVMIQQGFIPGVPHYGAVPFGVPTSQMVPPPGVVPGSMTGWPPMPQHPGDMQKLAEMMNMQAAILSQTGALRPPMVAQPAPANMQSAKRKAPTQGQQSRPSHQRPDPAKSVRTAAQNSVIQKITPVDFHGKKISCLVKNSTKQQFALIEAISRVYFPHCSLEEFINAITKVLQIAIYQLNREEEKAFIDFYGLPTETLKCNKVLNLKDLDQFMPQLKYMFTEKEQSSSGSGQATGKTSTAIGPANQDTNNNGATTSQSSAVPVPTASHLPPSNPFKKGTYKAKPGALAKMSSKLEDAVNRLRQNKMMEMTETDIPSDTSSTVVAQTATIPRNPFEQNESN